MNEDLHNIMLNYAIHKLIRIILVFYQQNKALELLDKQEQITSTQDPHTVPEQFLVG